MEKETIKKQIIDILKSGEYGCDTGVRVQTAHPDAEQAVVGEYLPDSYDWDDSEDRGVDESTGNQIDGVCTIGVNVDNFLGDIDDDIDEAFEKLDIYAERGKEIILVGGTGSYEGEDPGERIIQNAKCLAILNIS